MEAVRRDWTGAAKKLQIKLLSLVFDNTEVESIRSFIREFLETIYSGSMDHELIYKKALRKNVESYTSTIPPHVKAAMLLDPEDQRGVIEYYLTVEGPQPVSKLTAAIDYEHYVVHQLMPVTQAIALVLQTDLEALFKTDPQTSLF